MKYLFMKNCEAQAKSKYQILCSKNPKSLPSSNKRDMDWGWHYYHMAQQTSIIL